jgi:lactoylglutathione lyase
MANIGGKWRPFWQQTMLRIKSPKVSVPFYETHFGMKLVDEYHFPTMNFSIYFLATLPPTEVAKLSGIQPGSEEAHDYLWNMKYATIELTHNHGTENQDDYSTNNGNVEPHRGFGHIAFNTDDVYKVSEELEAAGVKFHKRPNDGNMKGIAFALDPDGYWLELVRRSPAAEIPLKFNLSQTMMRIKDPKKSLPFYTDLLGMTIVCEKHFPQWKFSLYFLSSLSEGEAAPDPKGEEGNEFTKKAFNPVLELTHNHGTEDDEAFSYHNGNTDPKGFGHIGFLVDDVYKACEHYEQAGVSFIKKPDGGKMRGLAFVKDPDGYWVEIIQRGLKVTLQE